MLPPSLSPCSLSPTIPEDDEVDDAVVEEHEDVPDALQNAVQIHPEDSRRGVLGGVGRGDRGG